MPVTREIEFRCRSLGFSAPVRKNLNFFCGGVKHCNCTQNQIARNAFQEKNCLQKKMDFSPGGSQNRNAPAAFKVLTASRFFSSGFVPCDLLSENPNIFWFPLITWTIFLYSCSAMFRKICCCSVSEAPEQLTFAHLATRLREKTAACSSLLRRVSKVVRVPLEVVTIVSNPCVCAVV